MICSCIAFFSTLLQFYSPIIIHWTSLNNKCVSALVHAIIEASPLQITFTSRCAAPGRLVMVHAQGSLNIHEQSARQWAIHNEAMHNLYARRHVLSCSDKIYIKNNMFDFCFKCFVSIVVHYSIASLQATLYPNQLRDNIGGLFLFYLSHGIIAGDKVMNPLFYLRKSQIQITYKLMVPRTTEFYWINSYRMTLKWFSGLQWWDVG